MCECVSEKSSVQTNHLPTQKLMYDVYIIIMWTLGQACQRIILL